MKLFFQHLRSNKIFARLFLSYTILCLLLFLYSFTQIDLNLTLVSYPLIHAIQKPFIYLGYFMRPLSTGIFLGFVITFFALFFVTLKYIALKKISGKELVMLVLLIVGLLLFSYPAFSHDIFNYMFDAKIFTEYGKNPYEYRALDFPEDPWVRFMHWTHRTYPYGPVFLPISIAISFIGMNIFPLTLFLFKALMAVSYLVSSYFIYKIMEKIKPDLAIVGTAFFALNPLVIFEVLVSAHHDLIMMSLALWAVYLFLIKKKIISFFVFLLSVGVKYVSIGILPMYVVAFHPLLALSGVLAATIAIVLRLELQPWYLLWVLPFAAIYYQNIFIRFLTIIASFVFLLRYAIFLYHGEWPVELLNMHISLVIYSLILAILSLGIRQIFLRKI